MADALAAGEQAVCELLGLQVHVAVDVLEPLHPISGGALQLERFGLALALVLSQRRHDVSGALAQYPRERHRILHGQLGTRPDAEVRGVRGIADEDDVAMVPALAQDPLEGQPDRRAAQVPRVGDQRLPSRRSAKSASQNATDSAVSIWSIPARLPVLLRGLDDERRPLGIEAIRVEDEPAPGGLAKVEGERIELPAAAQPDESIVAYIDIRTKDVGVRFASDGGKAVGRDDQVVAGGVRVGVGDLRLEHAARTPSAVARCCRISRRRIRAMPQKPWPPDVNVRPLKWTSMSSQWRNARVMAACVSGSASLNPSIVLSENTTPQPNVSVRARLRSTTVMSAAGSAFFARIAKYSPAGPPPRHAIFMRDGGASASARRASLPCRRRAPRRAECTPAACGVGAAPQRGDCGHHRVEVLAPRARMRIAVAL